METKEVGERLHLICYLFTLAWCDTRNIKCTCSSVKKYMQHVSEARMLFQ